LTHFACLNSQAKTGFLKQVEALILELDEPVVLLRVEHISDRAQFEDSLFEIDVPAGVSDNTTLWTESHKSQRAAEEEARKPEAPARRPRAPYPRGQ
jgi:hypothetical protein